MEGCPVAPTAGRGETERPARIRLEMMSEAFLITNAVNRANQIGVRYSVSRSSDRQTSDSSISILI